MNITYKIVVVLW